MAEGLYKTTGQVAAVIGNPGTGFGQPSRGRDHGAPRGRAAARDHLAAPARDRLSVAAVDLPGPGSARRLQAAVKWGGPIFVVGAHSRRSCGSPSARCGPAGPGRCRSSCPAPVLYATGDEASVRVPRPRPYRAALPEASEARIAQAGRSPRRGRAPARRRGLGRRSRRGQRGTRSRSSSGSAVPCAPRWPGARSCRATIRTAVYGLGAGGDLAKREADVVLVVGLAARQPRPAVRQVLGRPRARSASCRSTSTRGTSA